MKNTNKLIFFISFNIILMLANFSYASNIEDITDVDEICFISKNLAEEVEGVLSIFKLDKNKQTACINDIASLKTDKLSNISHALKRLVLIFAGHREKTKDIINIQDKIIFLQAAINGRPRKLFQQKVREYFSQIFQNNFKEIELADKPGGRQLGNKILITLNDGTRLTYYAKTHGAGVGSSSSSSSAHPVDPKELFVYKFLEFSQLGNETHFFYDDSRNFYIATKDAGFNEVTGQQEEFCTYNNLPLALKSRLHLEEKDEISINPIIADCLIISDIISRIFKLSDLVSNWGNIGFSLMDGEIKRFKIIDFDVSDSYQYNSPEVYQGFLSGNGVHNYAHSGDAIIRYFLSERNLEKRIQNAKNIMNTEKLIESIDNAYNDVRSYLTQENIDISQPAFDDLERYITAVKNNLEIFSQQLNEDQR